MKAIFKKNKKVADFLIKFIPYFLISWLAWFILIEPLLVLKFKLFKCSIESQAILFFSIGGFLVFLCLIGLLYDPTDRESHKILNEYISLFKNEYNLDKLIKLKERLASEMEDSKTGKVKREYHLVLNKLTDPLLNRIKDLQNAEVKSKQPLLSYIDSRILNYSDGDNMKSLNESLLDAYIVKELSNLKIKIENGELG